MNSVLNTARDGRLGIALNTLYVTADLVDEDVIDLDARLVLDLVALALTERMPAPPEHDVQRLVVGRLLQVAVLALKVVGVVRLNRVVVVVAADGHIHRRGAVTIAQLVNVVARLDLAAVEDLRLEQTMLPRVRIIALVVVVIADH